MNNSSILTLVVFVGIVFLSATQCSGRTVILRESDGFIPLRDLLKDIGNKYDCHFTVEMGMISGNRIHSLENVDALERVTVQNSIRDMSLDEALRWLRNTVPNLVYEFNKSNPKVVHIIDARLLREKDYVMEKPVDKLSFDGSLFDFVIAIGQKGLSVSSRGAMMDTREFNALDLSTRIRIKDKAGRVRDILTNSLILNGRGRVLWIAETELGKDRTTFVRYLNSNF